MSQSVKKITGGITTPKGFLAAGIHCGIKKKRMDLAVIYSETIASVAGTFTQHAFAAAPVGWSKQVAAKGRARAIIANSGNANSCTGHQGIVDAKKMATQLAHDISINKNEVLVASTGVIGKTLPMGKVSSGIHKLASSVSKRGAKDAAKAILTTDRVKKEAAYEFLQEGKVIKVAGIAKGAGMICPNMATMLSFITTDAKISSALLHKLLKEVVERTFNRITVDGDMSTNDMVLVLANGASSTRTIHEGSKAYRDFKDALYQLCSDLAKAIAEDGEGATKLVGIHVSEARDLKEAKKAAFAIANYNLFKVSVYAQNISWGRLLAALGSSGIKKLQLEKIVVSLNGKLWIHKGQGGLIAKKEYQKIVKSRQLNIDISLGRGLSQDTVWTCDLTHQYIDVNM